MLYEEDELEQTFSDPSRTFKPFQTLQDLLIPFYTRPWNAKRMAKLTTSQHTHPGGAAEDNRICECTVGTPGPWINIRKCSVEAGPTAVPAVVAKDACQAVTALHHGESTFSAIYDSSRATAVMWSTHGHGAAVPARGAGAIGR
ncbi:hypothetical protein N9L68_01265 [bacterium]|nr:hypothetical protein [bacterium]